MSPKDDRFSYLTDTDLRLIARSRGLTVPANAGRLELVALLKDRETPQENIVTEEVTREKPLARTGWWSALSVSELRSVAREHGIDVPAGLHRQELVDLLIEHDVPRPSRPRSRTTRGSD